MAKILENREDTSGSNSPLWGKVIAWGGKNWFYITLSLLAVIGVPCAFFVPPMIPGLTNDGNTVVSVRQGILAVLAGALTMLTLWETHRKNTQEKDKNDRDHIRQVHAERRSRYTKAVEQLGDEKAAVRLGGIYTLVSLVDEWFTDPDVDIIVGRKEGQVIINNLCSYIRSPFPLAENKYFLEKKNLTDNELKRYNGDFKADQKKLQEEKDIRRAILSEIKYRCGAPLALDEDGGESFYTEFWPSFVYDFSYANFFYPVYFNDVFFKSTMNFADATFKDYTNFSNSIFLGHISFSSTAFEDLLEFSQTYFESPAYFEDATFHNISIFENSFFSESDFSRAEFNSIATFKNSCFDKSVKFDATVFTNVDFSNANFKESTDFSNTKFKGSAFFDGSTITNKLDADSE